MILVVLLDVVRALAHTRQLRDGKLILDQGVHQIRAMTPWLECLTHRRRERVLTLHLGRRRLNMLFTKILYKFIILMHHLVTICVESVRFIKDLLVLSSLSEQLLDKAIPFKVYFRRVSLV